MKKKYFIVKINIIFCSAAAAAAVAAAAAPPKLEQGPRKPKPLLRSRTLPAIVVPGINILQAQIEARYRKGNTLSFSNLIIITHIS